MSAFDAIGDGMTDRGPGIMTGTRGRRPRRWRLALVLTLLATACGPGAGGPRGGHEVPVESSGPARDGPSRPDRAGATPIPMH